MPTQITFEGMLRPDQEKGFVHLPFDVPPAATRLDVSYAYSNQINSDPLLSGGNTVDLGVFDERGIGALTGGFRGWSGSERMAIFIGESAATPGYLPGPLRPGRWHVHLGLYKIAAEGCAYQATVTIATEPGHKSAVALPALVSALPSSPPPARSAPWLCGELHCHTFHSDGELSPLDVAALARRRGLDFLAITDHNSIASQSDLARLSDPGLILIPGTEVTTFKGHFNIWGIGDWVDFRVQTPEEMEAVLRFARARVALISCNHPKPFGPPWAYPEVTGYDCIEVWNGPWFAANQYALDFWAHRIAQGERIPALAGSDFHRRSEMEDEDRRAPGAPVTWVYVPGQPGADAILSAIREGHISMSSDIDGPQLELCAGPGLAAMGGDALPRPADGRLPVQVRCRRGAGCRLQLLDQSNVLFEHTFSAADETVTADLAVADSVFVRAELRDADEAVTALSNPIYLG